MSLAVSDQGYETGFWRQLINPFSSDNQSFYALTVRAIWFNEENFAGQSTVWLKSIFKAVSALILLASAFFIRGRRNNTSTERLFFEYSLFPMLMVFVSPVTQIHHYTILLVFFLGILTFFDQEIRKSRFNVISGFVWVAAIFYLLGLAESSLGKIGLLLFNNYRK